MTDTADQPPVIEAELKARVRALEAVMRQLDAARAANRDLTRALNQRG